VRIALLLLGAAVTLGSVQARPLNATCPVKGGMASRATITSTWQGHLIGFCCGGCKTRFDKAPEPYAALIPEIPAPPGPPALGDLEEALSAGKRDSRPVVVLFTETTLRTNVFLKVLHDPAVAEILPKTVYARVEYRKDSTEAKRWKVPAAPVLLVLDASGEAPKELRRLAGGGALQVRAILEGILKKFGS
jgi:hypothetical protein